MMLSNSDPNPPSVLLVGYQDQDNLGLRYLVAAARQAGFSAAIATYDSDPTSLLQQVQRLRPDLMGFSLIFQYMTEDFGHVIGALRDAGVSAHFTHGRTLSKLRL